MVTNMGVGDRGGEKRAYRLGARADAMEALAARVVTAWNELFERRIYDEVTLNEVAARAGVSVPTIMRHFGGKEGLALAGWRAGVERARDLRGGVGVGDVEGAVASLVAHYEELGDVIWGMLVEEHRLAGLREMTEMGRQLHGDWVEHTFAPMLEGLTPAVRKRRHAELVIATDVYTWKLLRRDKGWSKTQVAKTLVEMLNRLGQSQAVPPSI
jgi:AcrR family transcriptional regulator